MIYNYNFVGGKQIFKIALGIFIYVIMRLSTPIWISVL